MSFLDTTTSQGGQHDSKPTDKHQYLLPSSCHPKHCFKSIPFSQAIRGKRICSTVETTKHRLGDLHHHLKRRGYNDSYRVGFQRLVKLTDMTSLSTKKKNINKWVPLVLTYHPSLFRENFRHCPSSLERN